MKTENFAIRPATAADVPIILELIRALATYERAPNEVTATEDGLNKVLFGEKPAAEVLLAFENETAVGFAVFFHNFSTWLGRPGLYLEDLFVRPEDRGKGYGRALLIHLAKIARDRGCGRMEWAVLDWNEPAIQFYRKLGAKSMDEWTVFRLKRDGIRNLRTPSRVNNSCANQSRDQVLTRDDTDQISFLIDDRGQAKPRSPQSLDGARGRFTFLDRDHSPDIAANRPRVVSIEQNIDHIHQTDRIAVGSDHG